MRFQFLFAFGLFAGLSGVLLAKPEPSPIPPPTMAKAIDATVNHGGSVEIYLESFAAEPGTLYEIRSMPQKGQLGSLQVTPDGRGRVAYTHNRPLGSGTDTFYYVAKNPDSLFSSKTPVTIEIPNPPPRLEAEIGDFGNVPLGTTEKRILVLKNTGGDPFQGLLRMKNPWRVDSPKITVDAGRSIEIPVYFEPETAGDFSSKLTVDGEGGCVVNLTGTVYDTFQVDHQRILLQTNSDQSRSAKIRLSNSAPDALSLAFETTEDLEPLQPISVDPGQTVEIEIRANAAMPAPSSGILRILENRKALEVRCDVPALAGKLEFNPAKEIEFEPCEMGQSVFQKLEIVNNAGISIEADIQTPSWIQADRRRLFFRPGERITLNLEATPTQAGSLREPLIVDAGKGHRYQLSASVVVSPGEAELAAQSEKSAPSDEPAVVDLRQVRQQSIRVLSVDQSDGQIELQWRNPPTEVVRYDIERLEISSLLTEEIGNSTITEVGSEKFSPSRIASERIRVADILQEAGEKGTRVLKKWHPLEGVTLVALSDKITKATFPAPAGLYSLRVRITPVFEHEVSSTVRTEIRIPLDVETSPQRTWIWWVLATTAGLALVLLLVWLIRR
jgi:hypothetical protein